MNISLHYKKALSGFIKKQVRFIGGAALIRVYIR
jgi:hypothetical protein